jgi:hypothetical protein
MKILNDPITGGELWQLTNSPKVNLTHLYHNVDAFSPDGRYLAYAANCPYSDKVSERPQEVFVYDLLDREICFSSPGAYQVWSPTQNTLVFQCADTIQAMNFETGEKYLIIKRNGLVPGSVDHRGKWLFCFYNKHYFLEKEVGNIERVKMDSSGEIETIFRSGKSEWLCNPRANPSQDVLVVRQYQRISPDMDSVKAVRMLFMDSDGANVRPVSTGNEWHHHCWSGDGEWYIMGGRRKRWNAAPDVPWIPLGYAGQGFNHTGPCGRDGRFLTGDYANDLLYIFNLLTFETTLLSAPLSNTIPYSKNADPHAIGSPDGTKIVFDSLFDLGAGAVSLLAKSLGKEDIVLQVDNGKMFPENGHLIVGNSCRGYEIIQYQNKENNFFKGCRRGLQMDVEKWMSTEKTTIGMLPTAFGAGTTVMDFNAVFNGTRPKEPEIYIQVIRPPQTPVNVNASRNEKDVEVTWDTPCNHLEIKEYMIYRKENDSDWLFVGRTSYDTCVYRDEQPGSKACLYAVTSVEWCGLESDKSLTTPLASADGRDLPDEMLIPAGDFLRETQEKKRSLIATTLDVNAHNRTAISQQNGDSSVSYEFQLPMRVSADVRIRAKTPGCSSFMIIILNDTEKLHVVVQNNEFTWFSAHPAMEKQLPLFKKGKNRIKIITPAEKKCVFDQIQLKFHR